MTRTMFRASAVVGALVLAAACGKKDDALKNDTTLSRDLAMAGQDTAAKPALTDVPKATPPATNTKAKTTSTTKAAPPATKTAPAPAKATSGVVAAGTTLSLATAAEVCTNTNKIGDTFTATLKEPVAGSNGVTIPAGAVVTFSISKLNRSENVNDPIEMVFAPTSIAFGGKSYAMEATITPGFHVDKVKANAQGATAKKVVGGAAVGAIAGQLLGKNTKSTVVGAAVGAAAGGAAAAATSNYEGCVRNNTAVTVTLSAGLTLPVA
jgi:hypothetical protein